MINRITLNRLARVYFAGKVNGRYEPDFWRRDWFGVAQEEDGSVSKHVFGEEQSVEAVYAGPCLSGSSDAHKCVMHENAVGEKPHNRELAIYEQCLSEISQSDIIVARLSEGAYATMFETGYAKARNIPVIPFAESHDMWFASPGCGWGDGEFSERRKSFVNYVNRTLAEHAFFYRWKTLKCESPIETLVCEAMYAKGYWSLGSWASLQPQYPILGYRVDLAIPKYKLAFEFDGYTYHHDRAAFNRDRERDRKFTDNGWTVVRFHGDEIRSNPNQVANQINSRMRDAENSEACA
jgi:very-short-patch-repair endonuclease